MKLVYIETFGCQMNKADSEHMLGLLDEIDYKETGDIKYADLVIFNTCTIREAANERFYGHLGIASGIKKEKQDLLIAIGGCIAQDKRNRLQSLFPFVDIVFGTNNIHRLPELIKKAEKGEVVCEVFEEPHYDLPELPVIRKTKVTAWVNVILGCNFNCTYCIVPFVRGRERSRKPEDILEEVRSLAENGYKEVTLLGQNVTAYGFDLSSNYSREKATFGYIPEDPEYSLGKLLRLVNKVEGLERIRFITGHPYHVTDELISAVEELPKACEYFHVPMQSGDNNVLRRMARIYTTDMYKKMVDKIRVKVQDAAITSDFIVGFPGETEEQFLNTVKIVQELEFDGCNTAAYSPRSNTKAALWDSQVPEEEKSTRLKYLNSVISEVLEKKSKKYLDTVQEILVEGRSERNENRLTGKTKGNKTVNFGSDESFIGKLVNVKITKARSWALFGEVFEIK